MGGSTAGYEKSYRIVGYLKVDCSIPPHDFAVSVKVLKKKDAENMDAPNSVTCSLGIIRSICFKSRALV